MKKIAVLVDLTEGSRNALKQAHVLAQRSGAELVLVHVAQDKMPAEIHGNIIEGFVRPVIGMDHKVEIRVGHGKFMEQIPALVAEVNPDLLVLCTHGIHGLAQNLFGAHVLKLVQSVPYPCYVVQEKTAIRPEGPKHLLLPASPFADFEIKMKQCGSMALLFDSEVCYYEIDKYLGDTEELIANNARLSANYMAGIGARYKHVLDENKDRSLGFAQQTINYANENHIDLICLSSDTHHEFMAMGKADKEKLLTNDKAIAVLCCS